MAEVEVQPTLHQGRVYYSDRAPLPLCPDVILHIDRSRLGPRRPSVRTSNDSKQVAVSVALAPTHVYHTVVAHDGGSAFNDSLRVSHDNGGRPVGSKIVAPREV